MLVAAGKGLNEPGVLKFVRFGLKSSVLDGPIQSGDPHRIPGQQALQTVPMDPGLGLRPGLKDARSKTPPNPLKDPN